MTDNQATTPAHQHYDIVIIGGGMVGASLACMLSAPGLRHKDGSALKTLVIEPFAPPSDASLSEFQPSFDSRATALSQGSRLLLERIGVWSQIEKHYCPIERVHVSERGRWGSTLLESDVEGLPALGYVVENQWLGKVLLGAMRNIAEMEVFCPARVEHIQPQLGSRQVAQEQTMQLRISADKAQMNITATLAVVADGAHSAMCEHLGVDIIKQDYQQHALISTVSFAAPHQGVAYERFTDQGPLALLPLAQASQPDPRAALIWTLPSEQIQHWLELPEDEFLGQLQLRFGYRLGRFRHVGKRQSYPLSLSQAAEQIRPNVVIMGNAAHTLHPVAGQGFNLALRDAAALTDCLAEAVRSGENIASLEVLQRYQQAQRADQRRTTQFSDQLPKLFSHGNALVQASRRAGLLGFDLLPSARSALVRVAAGLRGDRARLER